MLAGCVEPVGQAVSAPLPDGEAEVKESTTAPTPALGTLTPPSARSRREPAGSRTLGAASPVRVSSTRVGVTETKESPLGYHPSTSTSRYVEAEE